MLSWLWRIDPEKRAILSWLGGGAVVVAGGIWTFVTFVVEHKDGPDKKGGATITVQQGIGSVGEINGPVSIGPNKEQIEQIQKPSAEQLATKDAQIAALTKALLEKNPVAAPGVQQAVGPAVRSIAHGAAEGDTRLQQALDLLRENKIADATQLLNAVAEDKTARAGQETALAAKDQKDAAIAYRNLGAFAGLNDPKKALEAYAKAVELDPADRESLYWHGWLNLLAGNLAVADQSLGQLLKLASAADDQRGIYRANFRLGELAEERGNLVLGVAYEEKAKKIAIGRAAANAGDLECQRDLSVSYDKIGDV